MNTQLDTKAILIYDKNANCTIGVVKHDDIPCIPTDPISNYLVGEADGLGHTLKLISTEWSYQKALKLFHEAKPGEVDIICREPASREVYEKHLKATDRIYRTQAIPTPVKERVIRLWANGEGKSFRRIAREVGIALSTVQKIIKEGTSQPQKTVELEQ